MPRRDPRPENALSEQLLRTQRVLDRIAPDNIAPIPIAISFENRSWTVDLHVRTDTAEHESTGVGRRLEYALAQARLRLFPEEAYNSNGSPEGT